MKDPNSPYDSIEQTLGATVRLQDGGLGTVAAVCITGNANRIEYMVRYWYGGNRHELWCEAWEFEALLDKEARF